MLLASNPGVSNCIAGLAGAASYQSGVDRHFLWQRRNETVPEYNMTVHQVGACRGLANVLFCVQT